MSTRAAPETEAAFRLQAQTTRLGEIESALQAGRFNLDRHQIVQVASIDVQRAVTMLLANIRRYPYGNLDALEALTKISQKNPDHAVSVVRGIASIGGLEAANALKDFPKARNNDDAAAYVEAVAAAAAQNVFPSRTVEIVFAAMARKNPAVGNQVITALIRLDTDYGVLEAISLTRDNAERTAHLLPLLAAKPGYELPVVSLFEADRQGFLPLTAYVNALSNFGTDAAADCLSTIAVSDKYIPNRELVIEGIQRIGSDHAVELLGNLALSHKGLRIPALRSLFTLREAAWEGGRNDMSLFDHNLRKVLNSALRSAHEVSLSNTEQVSALQAAFKRADEINLGGVAGSYNELFNQVVQIENFRAEISREISIFTGRDFK